MATERVCVYLGASSPVNAAHTRLVRAAFDEGFDRVFVFLLRWSPARHGTSPESGENMLRKWLTASLSVGEQSRLTLEVVENDHDAGPRMRAVLGPEAIPDVEVCFSQKYAGQEERIQSDWLPIYKNVFENVKPRFLVDNTDPGAPACGTAKFVDAVKKFKV